ncbi:hypothetical protein [Caballeronia cordobensis]|uniref:hypothetical protein n=1 Tax=Caballeronia cordobensis TaxID=1353886 RepID=UPI000B2864CA|nr:hypothetical protein [Caballeronia cordobensis]
MANADGPEPVNSLVTEKADKANKSPTSANSDAPRADGKHPNRGTLNLLVVTHAPAQKKGSLT